MHLRLSVWPQGRGWRKMEVICPLQVVSDPCATPSDQHPDPRAAKWPTYTSDARLFHTRLKQAAPVSMWPDLDAQIE